MLRREEEQGDLVFKNNVTPSPTVGPPIVVQQNYEGVSERTPSFGNLFEDNLLRFAKQEDRRIESELMIRLQAYRLK